MSTTLQEHAPWIGALLPTCGYGTQKQNAASVCRYTTLFRWMALSAKCKEDSRDPLDGRGRRGNEHQAL